MPALFIIGVDMIGTIDSFISFAALRGEALDTNEAGVYMQKAWDYLNGLKWEGKPYLRGQDDAWPRLGIIWGDDAVVDSAGNIIDPIEDDGTEAATPKSVVLASYRLALLVADDIDLNPATSGAQTTRETIGPLTFEYDPNTIGNGPSMEWLLDSLEPWLDARYFGGGQFDVGRG